MLQIRLLDLNVIFNIIYINIASTLHTQIYPNSSQLVMSIFASSSLHAFNGSIYDKEIIYKRGHVLDVSTLPGNTSNDLSKLSSSISDGFII